jgi:hypothetical protein
LTETFQVASPVKRFDFKDLATSGDASLARIVEHYGIVYVTSITRDGCSGCEEQKPLYQELAEKIEREHPGQTVFSNVHVHSKEGFYKESEEAKKIFHHVAYPTYMIHLKSRHGVLEAYRVVYPKMEELGKQITESYELADHYNKEKGKTA